MPIDCQAALDAAMADGALSEVYLCLPGEESEFEPKTTGIIF